MRVDSGVAGEGSVVGIPKFHSSGKCTMLFTNINSDWMYNASSGLCIIIINYIILRGSLHLGLYIRESVDSLCRDGADAQYMQYLSKSRITSPQTR